MDLKLQDPTRTFSPYPNFRSSPPAYLLNCHLKDTIDNGTLANWPILLLGLASGFAACCLRGGCTIGCGCGGLKLI